jgi:hypothetical protein
MLINPLTSDILIVPGKSNIFNTFDNQRRSNRYNFPNVLLVDLTDAAIEDWYYPNVYWGITEKVVLMDMTDVLIEDANFENEHWIIN